MNFNLCPVKFKKWPGGLGGTGCMYPAVLGREFMREAVLNKSRKMNPFLG